MHLTFRDVRADHSSADPPDPCSGVAAPNTASGGDSHLADSTTPISCAERVTDTYLFTAGNRGPRQ
ncbi:hypothetical protein [Micromonospora sp. NPDC003776]